MANTDIQITAQLLGHPVSYYLWPSLAWTAGIVLVFAPLATWKLKRS